MKSVDTFCTTHRPPVMDTGSSILRVPVAARGHGRGPYPVMTRSEMRAGLDQLPAWVLEQKATANRHVIAVMCTRLAARGAGGSRVPGAGAGLAGAASRGGRRAGSSTEANNGEPPRIMTAWVGRLELRPASSSAAWSRLRWRADLRFLRSCGDRLCPLHSSTCRLRVYPPCTGGLRSRPVASCGVAAEDSKAHHLPQGVVMPRVGRRSPTRP